jgi:hypothetical protein
MLVCGIIRRRETFPGKRSPAPSPLPSSDGCARPYFASSAQEPRLAEGNPRANSKCQRRRNLHHDLFRLNCFEFCVLRTLDARGSSNNSHAHASPMERPARKRERTHNRATLRCQLTNSAAIGKTVCLSLSNSARRNSPVELAHLG